MKVRSDGMINSSFAVIFHIVAVVVGVAYSNFLPGYLGLIPLLVCIGLPILFFWFFYFLNHHADIKTAAAVFLTFALLCGLFAIIGVARGSAGEDALPVATPSRTIPQVTIPFLNMFFVSYTGSAPVLASVVMYYGALSYVTASALALAIEFAYDRLLQKTLSQTLRNKLAKADLQADKTMVRTFSDRVVMGQHLGMYAISIALAIFVALYSIVLIKIR